MKAHMPALHPAIGGNGRQLHAMWGWQGTPPSAAAFPQPPKLKTKKKGPHDQFIAKQQNYIHLRLSMQQNVVKYRSSKNIKSKQTTYQI